METAAGFFDVDPRRVAVVLVDFQNDFCSPDVFHGGTVTNTHNAATAVRASRFAVGTSGSARMWSTPDKCSISPS